MQIKVIPLALCRELGDNDKVNFKFRLEDTLIDFP